MEKITTMEGRDFASLSNEELLIEKKKLKKSKIIHAVLIGFLAGVFGFKSPEYKCQKQVKTIGIALYEREKM